MQVALVVPTIREDQIKEFLDSWGPFLSDSEVQSYIVEDNQDKSFKISEGENIRHISWQDAPSGMLDCITVKSPGCRQIGFWQAYQDGADLIVTLDDDVRPFQGNNIFTHLKNIFTQGLPVWIDPLLNYRSRGYPVSSVGSIKPSFHCGIFSGIPDVDAETQLKHQQGFASNPPRYHERPQIIPSGQLIPVNGGICAWLREITPVVHYTVWSKELEYYRYDDIWFGILLKTLFDQSGMKMSYGPPVVEHFRASDPQQNLIREKAGKLWNEEFWQLLQETIQDTKFTSNLYDNFVILADCLGQIDNHWARSESKAMKQWITFF